MSKYYKVKDVEVALIFSGLCDGKTCGEIKKVLNSIPTIDRLQGEWILQDNQHHIEKIYLCSNCENFEAWGESEKYNYCPNCGAHMKGADDES